jgi:membrane-associated phospholipid phosphatase
MAPPLSPPGRLGTHLAVGALLLILAAWLFGAIAEDVATGDRLTLLDEVFAQWLHRHATAPMTRAMLVVTHLNSTVAVACYGTALGLWLATRHDWRRVATLVACIGGGLTLNVLMKLAFHRHRPVFDEPLLTLSSYSFPSGHVAGSTVFYGLGVAWVFGRTTRWRWRALAVVGALVMIALVAFSRIYLGVHYLSDVAAAFAEGIAWLAICLSALATFWRRSPVAP